MSKSASVLSSRVEQAVLIVFADLTRFMVNSRSTPDATLAELLDGYYRHAEGLVSAAGGRIVKFMGDAFLAVWPEARAGDGVEALPVLKRAVDAWWAAKGWDSRVIMKAHFGRAVIVRDGRALRRDRERGQCGGDASGADGVAVRGGVPVPRERKAQGVQEAHGAGGVHPGGRSAALTGA
jgi:class 3 adenylate cyclase